MLDAGAARELEPREAVVGAQNLALADLRPVYAGYPTFGELAFDAARGDQVEVLDGRGHVLLSRPSPPPVAHELRLDQVQELLERYKAASDKITVEYIDPEKEPLRTTQLAEQFGVQVANTVVFIYGDRTKYVTSDQMADMDYSGMQYGQGPTMRSFKGEEQFTSAILSLVAPDVPKVYFVTGHGEVVPSQGGGPGERGLSVLAEALKRENDELSKQRLEKTEAESRTAFLPSPLYRIPLAVAMLAVIMNSSIMRCASLRTSGTIRSILRCSPNTMRVSVVSKSIAPRFARRWCSTLYRSCRSSRCGTSTEYCWRNAASWSTSMAATLV